MLKVGEGGGGEEGRRGGGGEEGRRGGVSATFPSPVSHMRMYVSHDPVTSESPCDAIDHTHPCIIPATGRCTVPHRLQLLYPGLSCSSQDVP
ncbi:hypothetical protein MAR_038498 [Mya arenaria]|uniref:Uncharacterized protein n=1 Tax=Mya arenaria TaxID=6604 RepID=A0ABY7FVA8_MYAAR|nr:hypothetical protein MAR_038498 [Mya arenaria]